MSKLSFRARALDATKPLPVYHAEELPDLSEYNNINRTVPQMPTGMEKEEESERHLQDVIVAQQTNTLNKKLVFIPTPEATITVKDYDRVTRSIDRPTQYIRVPGLGLEEEVPDYDLDSEDEEWLNAQTNERPLSSTHFESMMDKLEKGSGNTVLSEREAQALLKDDQDLVLAVYDYWLAKRLRLGRALIPTVKHEKRDGTSSSSNPYLAFRKRTEKMQTRKNRKNDETAYMQMLKLKRDLEKALHLAEMVKKREAKKHEFGQVHMDIFRKRYMLEDWSGSIMSSLRPVATRSATSRQHSSVSDSSWDGRTVLIKMDSGDDFDTHHVGRHEVLVPGLKKKRRKKYYYSNANVDAPPIVTPITPDKAIKDTSRDLSTDKFEEDDPDGIFTFKRKLHVKYHHTQDRLGWWPWYSDDELEAALADGEGELEQSARNDGGFRASCRKRYRFSRTSFSGCVIGRSRRRIGRGGRAMWDRIPVSGDEESMELDSEEPIATSASEPNAVTVSSPLPSTPVEPSGTSEGLKAQDKQQPPPQQSDAQLVTPECTDGGREEKMFVKCLHFLARSPSPSSTFELNSLPFIEQTSSHSTSPSSSTAVDSQQGSLPFTLGRFPFRRLPSEDDALSFSSLPTSQFALRPSSLDVECHELPSFSWQKSTIGSEFNTFNQNDREKNASLRQFGPSDYYGTSNSPLPLSTPSDIGSAGSSTSVTAIKGASAAMQQVHSHSEPVDMSRSSLSVADSKTIILSNAPSTTPSEKSKLVPQQNALQQNTRPTSLVAQGQQLATQNVDNSNASTTAASMQGGTSNSSSTHDSSGSLNKGATTQLSVSATSDGSSSAPQEKTQQKTPIVPLSAEKEPPSYNGGATTAVPSNLEAQAKPVPSVWLMGGPDSSLLQLNKPPKPGVGEESLKTGFSVFATTNTAQSVTSQFQQVLKKKEDILPPNAVMHAHNSTTPRSGSSIPVATSADAVLQPHLKLPTIVSNIGANALKLPSELNLDKVGPLVVDKRTSGIATGQAIPATLVTRRASTGTNGTNYQEIFHTAHRLSESTERGLKQALAGRTMMNRNSLLETAANSLVQLGNSSEVT